MEKLMTIENIALDGADYKLIFDNNGSLVFVKDSNGNAVLPSSSLFFKLKLDIISRKLF